MVKKFLSLEWKAFTRSASFNLHIALKILIAIGVAFYSLMFLILGAGVYFMLEESGYEPLSTINQYLIFWWVLDLVVRYFLQKLPVMRTKSFLLTPIRKGTIVSYLLRKSSLSFFNIYPAFFFLPFSIVLCFHGYSVFGVIAWNVGILSLVLLNNYLNILVDNLNSVFISLIVLLGGFFALKHYGIFDITLFSQPVFQSFYAWPIVGVLMALIPISLYWYCFHFFKSRLRLDGAIKKEDKIVDSSDYTWLDRFGTLGIFLKNDVRLIKRNKRARASVMMSLLFLFYGLIFVTNPAYSNPNWDLFCGIFVTGSFLFTFGGTVPSWDSAYYPLMMSQNIKYKEYLSSKWWLMVIATIISAVLSSFYLFFGWDVFLAMMVGAIFNIGVNSHLVLLGGAFVKTPIDLESSKKMFGDKKAFNIYTILIAFPKLALPILIFYIFRVVWSIEIGYLAVAITGVIGFAFKNAVFKMIEKIYKREKYATLLAYKQKN